MRGGSSGGFGYWLDASNRAYGAYPAADTYNIGLRVASVPEPSSLSMLVLGGVVVVLRRRKK
jgi:hypothetical protein